MKTTQDTDENFRYLATYTWADKSAMGRMVAITEHPNEVHESALINYAQGQGYHKLTVVSLFSNNIPDYGRLHMESDPTGPRTDETILKHCWTYQQQTVLACWGGFAKARAAYVLGLLRGVPIYRLNARKDSRSPVHCSKAATAMDPPTLWPREFIRMHVEENSL